MLKKLIEETKRNSLSYGSLPFWSWNETFDDDELRRQIRNMHDLKMNGFFMHARNGLVTEYLSDEWYHAINVCIDEAKKLGMEAWSYDEYGFPSGFAGGKLLEDPQNFACFIKHKVTNTYPEDDVLAVYVITDNRAKRVFEAIEGVTEYHVITVGYDSSYVDTLDKRVIARFIEVTHEDYKKRIAKEDFGTTMPGFFIDEPQCYRLATPWSSIFAESFQERFGYDIMDNLVALFVQCEGFRAIRFDYHKQMTDLFINSFGRQVYEWCEANGCQLTGHTVEENFLHTQIGRCGSAMRFYCYEHIPGIDYLGRRLSFKPDSLPQQLGSVVAQLGKKKALSETFGCCGWDTSPRELKNILDYQFANGVNLVCQHLYTYSARGERKHDYPLHFSEYLPWQKHLRKFNEHFNNLGYLLSRGEEAANTLVIHPIHNAYMYFDHEDQAGSVSHLDTAFRTLSDLLSRHQISYHYGDEDIMAEIAHVEGNTLVVGKCTYDKVLIPKVESLDSSTAKLLKEYAANGGKIILEGELPTYVDARPADYSWLKATMTVDELLAEEDMIARLADGSNLTTLRAMNRKVDGKRIFFLSNISSAEYKDVRVRVKNCKNLVKLDILTLEPSTVCGEVQTNGDFLMHCNFADSESMLLIESDECAALPLADFTTEDAPYFLPPKTVRFVERPENTLTLDTISYSFDGKNFEGDLPLMALRDDLLHKRYRGDLYVKQCFTVDEIPNSISFACETMPYRSVTVNGKEITLSDKLWREPCFRTADITSLVKIGKNEIVYHIDYFQRDFVYYVLYECDEANSLATSLTFDTELAETYLFGDFAVKTEGAFKFEKGAFCYFGDFQITKSKDTIDIQNVVMDGLPFFAGALHLGFNHEWRKGEPTILRIQGQYAVCEVYVGDKHANTLVFEKDCDLSAYLAEGNNEIELRLFNSNRNLLGPLHSPELEPYNIYPSTFTCENRWENGKSPNYLDDRYCFVRFGLDCK
ncbi:MAG: hypothetical protein E7606_05005 [Ruminococcaceae bacterium]|nr:hypothetical protein [Oscillospiraceae bacterium]